MKSLNERSIFFDFDKGVSNHRNAGGRIEIAGRIQADEPPRIPPADYMMGRPDIASVFGGEPKKTKTPWGLIGIIGGVAIIGLILIIKK